MPDKKYLLKVFLSYASQDKLLVQELSKRLAGEGWIDVWVDEKKLLPGQDWRTKIEEAVETSDIVIICLSNNSVTKEGFVQKELRYAREISFEKPDETIFLVPLRLDDCTVPRGLRFYQWADYFGENKEDTYNALTESLKIRYEQKRNILEKEYARLEKERQERELAEKIERERLEKERLEKEIVEKAKREEFEKNKREKIEKEKLEKQNAEFAEKVAREKAKQLAVEKVAREKEQQEKEKVEKSEFDKKPNKFPQKKGVAKVQPEILKKLPRQKKKTDTKSPQVETKGNQNQTAFWLGGFVVFIFFIWLSTLNESPPSSVLPEFTKTSSFTHLKTSEPTKQVSTATQILTNTPTAFSTVSITPTNAFTETPVENLISLDNSQKLYFVTKDDQLVSIDTISDARHVYRSLSISGSTEIFWLNSSELINFPSVEKFSINNIENSFEIINIENNNLRKVARSDYYYYTNFSDMSINNQIVIIFSGDANTSAPSISIATIDSQGNLSTVPTNVDVDLSTGSPSCIRWSPTGKTTAATVWQGLSSSLSIFRIGPGERPLVIKTNVRGCPSWSPDGKYIVYGNQNPSHLEEYEKGIFYIDYLSGAVTKLTDTYGYNPVWSPDGKKIAFINEEGISLINIETKEEKKIYSAEVKELLWGK